MKLSALKFALPLMAALGLSTTTVEAATGNWNGFATGPTIYQTNWYYSSSVMSPPSGIPSSARLNYISYSAKFSPTPTGLQTYLCSTNSPCYYLGGSFGSRSVPTSAYAATDQFRFLFRDYQSQTYTYSSKGLPNPVGGGHQLYIGYTY